MNNKIFAPYPVVPMSCLRGKRRRQLCVLLWDIKPQTKGWNSTETMRRTVASTKLPSNLAEKTAWFDIIQKYGMDFFLAFQSFQKQQKTALSFWSPRSHLLIFFSFFFFNVKNWILRGFLRTNLNQRWLLKRLNIPQLHLFENLLCEHPLPSGPELVLWMSSCAAISKQYSLVGFNKQEYVKPAI